MSLIQYDPTAQYDYEKKFILIKNFFSARLLEVITKQLESMPFCLGDFEFSSDVGFYMQLSRPQFFRHIMEELNDPAFLSFIRQITGDPSVVQFDGRFYRMINNTRDSFAWHQDNSLGRIHSISVNVTPTHFEGGELKIRKKSTGEEFTLHNTGPGDAIIFVVDEDYEHCVLPVKGHHPKYAMSGWFYNYVHEVSYKPIV